MRKFQYLDRAPAPHPVAAQASCCTPSAPCIKCSMIRLTSHRFAMFSKQFGRLPELNDEFAKEVGDYENLAALEARIREHLLATKQRQSEQQTREALFAALNERFAFPVPESLVQQQVDARLDRGLRALAQQGMNADMMRKLDFTRLRAAQRDSAVNEVKTSLLLDRIADAEELSVTDEEVDHEIYLAALQSREPVETLRARLTEDGGLARTREQLRREKTASLLYQRLPAA